MTRIESAVARAAREVAHTEPRLPASVAAAVADAIALRGLTEPVTVEEIQDLVEAPLNAAGLPDVARACIIYRQRRAELRAAKALVGVRDELKLSLAAVTVLGDRYLRRERRAGSASRRAS